MCHTCNDSVYYLYNFILWSAMVILSTIFGTTTFFIKASWKMLCTILKQNMMTHSYIFILQSANIIQRLFRVWWPLSYTIYNRIFCDKPMSFNNFVKNFWWDNLFRGRFLIPKYSCKIIFITSVEMPVVIFFSIPFNRFF